MGLCRRVLTKKQNSATQILFCNLEFWYHGQTISGACRGLTIGRFIIWLSFFHLSVRRVPYLIRCGTWRMHPSHAREATAAIMEHNVTQPTYSKAEAFRCRGGTNGNRDQDGGGCVCACVWLRGLCLAPSCTALPSCNILMSRSQRTFIALTATL